MDRFWSKVEPTGFCWVWLAGRDKHGYGQCKVLNKHNIAHRYAYELLVGPIPEGLVIDHLCRNRSCVNPDHLEAVTNAENLRRGIGKGLKSQCKHGHEYTDENTYYNKGYRQRRICGRARTKAYKNKQRNQWRRSDEGI